MLIKGKICLSLRIQKTSQITSIGSIRSINGGVSTKTPKIAKRTLISSFSLNEPLQSRVGKTNRLI